MFGSPRKLPGFLSQALGPIATDAASISKLSWLRMLCQGSLVALRLQSARLTKQAESSNTKFDGLYNLSLVRCS